MSKKILFVYSSIDGHTLKICNHMIAKNKSFAETFTKFAKQNPQIIVSDAEDVKKGIFFPYYILW